MLFRSLLVLFLGMIPALALPDLEDAQKALGSPDFDEREALTMELWNSGRDALPLLALLAKFSNPEIANRATFILNRVRMGLGPESPDELLKLAERADQAKPGKRGARLSDILEHPQGFRVALFFLNQWLSNQATPLDQRISLTETCIEPLLEQRSQWQELLTFPFSPEARAMLISTISIQEIAVDRKERMVAILASNELGKVHQLLIRDFGFLPAETHHTLARLAVLRGNFNLALETLAVRLKEGDDPEPARAIAFLENSSGLAPHPYQGPWLPELQLFRARADRDENKVNQRVDAVIDQDALVYESKLVVGTAEGPMELRNSEAILLSALHLAFASPPGEPDIEALTSSVLVEWPALARTLTALTHPVEAAERLSAEGYPDSSINLLWRTGHKKEALDLGNGILAGLDKELHTKVRLALSSLLLGDGQSRQAETIFRPLLSEEIRAYQTRDKAIRLARKFLPLEDTIKLTPHLTSSKQFQRDQAVTSFFDLPPDIASFWYEHLRNTSPPTPPAKLIEQIKQLLNENRAEAQQVIVDRIKESPTKTLLPSNPLYQNALFLQTPGALDMVIQAAWIQLSIQDLETIISSEDWLLEQRKKALREALLLDPANPVLHWLRSELDQTGDRKVIVSSTLGDPELALRLGHLTGKRETIATAALIASHKDRSTLRCLAALGHSHLRNNNPAAAARCLEAGLLGGMAMGTRPAPPISEIVKNLTALFQARHLIAPTESTQKIWRERLNDLGAEPLTTK